MALTVVKIAPAQPYDLYLSFQGIATYKILEYAPDGSGGWTLSKAVESAGHSTDPRHDAYEMTPVASGDQRLVLISANMSSVTGSDPVSIKAVFQQAKKAIHTDQASGKDSGALVTLTLRTVFQGT
jgi:hypothetical protein